MKIQYISDIHLEFRSTIPNIEPLADVLVLAGDIGYPFSAIYSEFLQHVSQKFKKVFLVAGNHEYYNDTKTMEEINEQITSVAQEHINICFLNDSWELWEGYKFVGSTLWSHIKDPQHRINDLTAISSMSVEFYNELHQVASEFLQDVLKDKDTPIVMITHHLPSFALIDTQFKTSHHTPYNQWFASHCDGLFQPPIQVWIYGHTHVAKRSVVNGILCVCNPLGYLSEQNALHYEVIEV
jgi:predicted phosphodiesterase